MILEDLQDILRHAEGDISRNGLVKYDFLDNWIFTSQSGACIEMIYKLCAQISMFKEELLPQTMCTDFNV